MVSAYKNEPYYVTYNPKGFDTFICDNKKQIYAVFDGMGTSPGARKAAEKCAELVGINTRGNEDWNGLRSVLEQCIEAVNRFGDPQAGCTATIVSIDLSGNLHYAHVGDSRLYTYNNGRIKQITADEGVGNLLLNYVGFYGQGIFQAGTVYGHWQKFMLCTDGVTGDWEDQLLDDELIEKAMVNGAQTACDELIAASKKQDDKTIIVVGK